MDSHKRVQASRSKSSKGNADPEILERGNWEVAERSPVPTVLDPHLGLATGSQD